MKFNCFFPQSLSALRAKTNVLFGKLDSDLIRVGSEGGHFSRLSKTTANFLAGEAGGEEENVDYF
jgi:hypothetical protein